MGMATFDIGIFFVSMGYRWGLSFGIEHFYTPVTINVFVNLYPIAVQRYNRVRITLMLHKMAS